MARRRMIVALLVAAVALSGCAAPGTATKTGEQFVSGTVPEIVPTPARTIAHGERHGTAVAQPDPFVIRYGTTELHLEAFTYCYLSGCVDGFDPAPLSIGSPDEIFVHVPVDGFDRLSATQVGVGDPCAARRVAADSEPLGGGWWRVTPWGPVGEYTFDLFASGSSGDMIASLHWTTASDHALPDPVATLALVVDHDGRPDSYGVELTVSGLAESPQEYSATITTTVSNGRSHTFEATASEHCAGLGDLYFDGPAAEGTAAAALGDFPFDYRVDLVLDGVVHVGTGTYPDDLTEAHGVAVALEFTPELP